MSTQWSCAARRPRALCFAIAVLSVAATALGARGQQPFPNPLDGPGTPSLKRSQQKKIEKAWSKLEAGRTADAVKPLRKVADTAAGRLLSLQIEFTGGGELPVAGLSALCSENPGYAAAWATLVTVLEASGEEAATLDAARRVAELWPESPWGKRSAVLEGRWVDARIADARARIDAGDFEGALDVLDAALVLQPTNGSALMTKAVILSELDRSREAERVLRPIADQPETQMLMARIAEKSGQLFEAMQHYAAVPEGTPGRDMALRRVKLEWRRQNLPGYVQKALESEELSRAELAIVLVGLIPEANAIGGGQVPVLSDIVDLPSQREVVTLVRLGLLQVDQIQHQFDPERPAKPAEVRRAVDGLCRLLDIEPPPWCTEISGAGEPCALLESPVSGRALADVILQATHGESQ